jgi:hypothetical protein
MLVVMSRFRRPSQQVFEAQQAIVKEPSSHSVVLGSPFRESLRVARQGGHEEHGRSERFLNSSRA